VKILVERDIFGDNYTTSRVFIDGRFFCYCLEDTDRKLEDNPEAKVYGETAIPRGTYKLLVDFSGRFQRELPRLLDVPGYSGIRIHAGNVPADTHGCLLLGTSRKDGMVVNSRIAMVKFMELLDLAYDRGERVEVTIE